MNVVILKKIDPKANYIKLDVTEIVQSHIVNKVPVERLLLNKS